jgi:hypothetical protein
MCRTFGLAAVLFASGGPVGGSANSMVICIPDLLGRGKGGSAEPSLRGSPGRTKVASILLERTVRR